MSPAASFADRLASAEERVRDEAARLRAAGFSTSALEADAAELADSLAIERSAARRRQELPTR